MSAPGLAEERLDPKVWRVTAVVVFAPLMTNLDSTVVNVSLATLSRELRSSMTTITWVVTGYLLALALMLPLSGWLVDRIGAKRLYLVCFALFTVASMLCGIANSAETLIAARVLQGMAGGLLAPMSQMVVAREAGRHMARVMGLLVVPVLLGPILGPTLASLILQHASWRWIFFINLPIGVLAILFALWLLPKDEDNTSPRPLDIPGLLLIGPGLVLFLYCLEQISVMPHPVWEIVGLVTAVGMLGTFVWWAKLKGEKSLIDLRLFGNKTFAASTSTQFLVNAAAYGGQLLLPLYLQKVLGLSLSETGWLLALSGIAMLISYPSMGFLTEQFGARRVSTTGALVAMAGTLPFALVPVAGMSHVLIGTALFVRGLGLGSISIPSISSAYSSIPKSSIPIATTALNIVQRLGGPVATTVLAIFLHSRGGVIGAGAASVKLDSAFMATFWLLCGLHLVAFVTASRLPQRQDRATQNNNGLEKKAEPILEAVGD